MKERFIMRSVAEDGSILCEGEVLGVEEEPFEKDSINGKGKLRVEEGAFEVTEEHDHFEWERIV